MAGNNIPQLQIEWSDNQLDKQEWDFSQYVSRAREFFRTKAGLAILMAWLNWLIPSAQAEEQPACWLVWEQFYDQQDKEGVARYESIQRAANFLKSFPKYQCNEQLISVIAEGEREFTKNYISGRKKTLEQKIDRFYGYMIRLSWQKGEIIWLRIDNMKKFAPDFYAKLYKNEYSVFDEWLNEIIRAKKKTARAKNIYEAISNL